MERPFVYINMAMTADGKITSASREYPKLTSELDRRTMDRLRAEADAILVGAETLRSDDPWLHVRGEQMQAYRRSLGKSEGLVKIALTSSLRLDLAGRFFQETDGGPRIIATVDDADAGRLSALAGRAEVWRVGQGRVDLPRLLERLHARGVRRLLAEGGSEVNWALFRQDLVDEIYITLAPSVLGGTAAPTPVGGEGFSMREQKRLKLLDLRREGDELYLRYAVVR